MPDWQPLLEGSERQCALDLVDGIARDLAAREPEGGGLLDGGAAGHATFFSYLARALGDDSHTDRAFAHLERAAAAADTMPLELFDGVVGVGWAIRHLQPGEEEPDDLDTAIHEFLGRPPLPQQPADLLYGDLGIAVYALERRAAGDAALERIAGRLAATAHRDDRGGCYWQVLEGYVNGGVPHGVPGVVAALATVAAARDIVAGAIDWLCAHRLPDGSFPGAVRDAADEPPVRHGWCYGDPGVAIALHRSGRPDAQGIAMERARFVGSLDLAGAQLRDASLCHGAAGVALILDRMHQDTGDPELGDAARTWFRRVVELAREGQGIGGYQFAREPGEWVEDASILTGAAGVGLALLAAATPIAPDWDRLLLLSAPLR